MNLPGLLWPRWLIAAATAINDRGYKRLAKKDDHTR